MTQWLIEEAMLLSNRKRQVDAAHVVAQSAGSNERLREMATRAVRGY